jgi:polysaccharide export outer membrane protein
VEKAGPAAAIAVLLLAACAARSPLPEQAPASSAEVDLTPPLLVEPAEPSFPEEPAPPLAASPGEARPLVPGDSIEVVVHGSPDLSMAFTVPSGGSVTFPPLGPVAVAGRTPFELEVALAAGLREEGILLDPQVAVLVKAYEPRRVYVLDGVRRPGDYALPEGRALRLTQVIALAGGFLETARREQVTLFRTRSDGTVGREPFDAGAILAGSAADPPVLPEDTLVVAVQDTLEERIFVAGQVKHPGAYAFRVSEGVTVLRAIVLAGGFDKYADTEGVVVVRAGEDGRGRTIRVDLKAALAGEPSKDLPLRPGDVVIVPESFF